MIIKRIVKMLACVVLALTMSVSPHFMASAEKRNGSEVAEIIVAAINDRNPEAIKSLFSRHVQSSIPDLSEQIQFLIDQINIDSRIESYQFKWSGGSDSRDYGYYHSGNSYRIDIPIGDSDYFYDIGFHLIDSWTDDPSREGMSNIGLQIGETDNYPVELICEIALPLEESLHYKETLDTHQCKWDDKYFFSRLGYTKLVVSSSDESVATISEDGIITATGRGTARVTITYRNEELNKDWSFEYDVTVTFTTWQKIIWYLFFGFLWY